MEYSFHKKMTTGFDEAKTKVTNELKAEGFGIITEIDLQEKFKEKLQVSFRKYTILGACHPASAHKAVLADDKIGLLLPCNILVQESETGGVEVAAINPMASIGGVENEELQNIASEVTKQLKAVIDRL